MGFGIHLVVYVAVNALLVVIWAAFGGDDRSIADALAAPLDAARDEEFWPFWVMTTWGVALPIHAAVAVGLARRRRRRRRRQRRIARAEASRQHVQAPAPARPLPTAAGRRWVVALFTDVVGSTGLAEALGDDEWNQVIGAHRRLVRDLVARHDGGEVGTQGDGFLLRFDDPDRAVRCAAELQRRFERDRQAGRFTPPVRMGLHAGEVHGAEDGDLVGRMVNVAARVTAVADAGEILVTEAVADLLPPGVALRDRGLHELRGLDRPRHLLGVQWRDEPITADLADDGLADPLAEA